MEIVMEAHVKAMWNEERGLWEVDISQTETQVSNAGVPMCGIDRQKLQVEACDELVLGSALLYINGIDTGPDVIITPTHNELNNMHWFFKK